MILKGVEGGEKAQQIPWVGKKKGVVGVYIIVCKITHLTLICSSLASLRHPAQEVTHRGEERTAALRGLVCLLLAHLE